MIKIEATGKTIEEATENAYIKAGVDRERCSIEVLEFPQKKGFFGHKTTEAKVQLTYED